MSRNIHTAYSSLQSLSKQKKQNVNYPVLQYTVALPSPETEFLTEHNVVIQ